MSSILDIAQFIDGPWTALVSDFNLYYDFMKPFIAIADGASELIGLIK